MAACSNDMVFTNREATATQQTAENAIMFSVRETDAGTRAFGETNSLATGEAIGVFASYTGDIKYSLASVLSNYMYNQKVTKQSDGSWTYNPVKYWPNTSDLDGDDKEYMSFFSYYPYSESGSSDGIIGFSNADASGDPWLVYQLPDNAPTAQTDLLYGVKSDGNPMLDVQKHDASGVVSFSLCHALACVGDQVNIRLSEALSSGLGTRTLTVNKVTINYKNLTNKAKLVLNSGDTPNWQPVISGEYVSSRQVVISSGIPTLTTSNQAISTNQGLFYIPMHLGALAQEAEITVDYTIGKGSWNITGSVTNSYTLAENAQKKESINIVLGNGLLADPGISAQDVTSSDKFSYLATNGKVYKTIAQAYIYGGQPCAFIAYVGKVENYFDRFIAIALEDERDADCNWSTAMQSLVTPSDHYVAKHPVTIGGITYQYSSLASDYYDTVAGNAGVSSKSRANSVLKGWRIPSVTDWRYIFEGFFGISAVSPVGIDDADGEYATFDLRSNMNSFNGVTGLQEDVYWTSSYATGTDNNYWCYYFSSSDNDFKYQPATETARILSVFVY